MGYAAQGWFVRSTQPAGMEHSMELWIIAFAVLGLVVFDILALRFGADSRPEIENPHDWS